MIAEQKGYAVLELPRNFVEPVQFSLKLFVAVLTTLGVTAFAYFSLLNDTKEFPELQRAVLGFSQLFIFLFLEFSTIFLAFGLLNASTQANYQTLRERLGATNCTESGLRAYFVGAICTAALLLHYPLYYMGTESWKEFQAAHNALIDKMMEGKPKQPAQEPTKSQHD